MIRKFVAFPLALVALSTQALGQAGEVEATAMEIVTHVKADAPMLGSPADRSARTRMTVMGDRIRIDAIEGSSPQVLSTSASAYSLSVGGVELYTIDTVKKEYSRIDVAEMKKVMSNAMSMLGELQMKVSGSKFEVDSLGPGEVVLGHPTQRWKSLQSMTIAASLGADSMAMSMENRTESLYAADVSALSAVGIPGQDSLTSFGAFGSLITDEMLERMMTAYRRLPKGMPIRSVTTSIMMTGISDITMVTTTEVQKIEKAMVPASFFELPKNYKQVDLDLPGLKPSTHQTDPPRSTRTGSALSRR